MDLIPEDGTPTEHSWGLPVQGGPPVTGHGTQVPHRPGGRHHVDRDVGGGAQQGGSRPRVRQCEDPIERCRALRDTIDREGTGTGQVIDQGGPGGSTVRAGIDLPGLERAAIPGSRQRSDRIRPIQDHLTRRDRGLRCTQRARGE